MSERIDGVDLRSVMAMDWEGPGLGANSAAPEKIALIPVKQNIGGVRVAALVDGVDSKAVVNMVSEGGNAHG